MYNTISSYSTTNTVTECNKKCITLKMQVLSFSGIVVFEKLCVKNTIHLNSGNSNYLFCDASCLTGCCHKI